MGPIVNPPDPAWKNKLYAKVFSSDNGRAVLMDIVRSCHVLSPVTVGDSALATAFNDGQRSVALSILNRLAKVEGFEFDSLLDVLVKAQDNGEGPKL